MPFDLPHIAARVFDTPLLLHRGKLDTILAAVGPRLLDGLDVEVASESTGLRAERRDRSAYAGGGRRRFGGGGYLWEDGVGVLPIHGTLIRRGSWLDSASGMTSYGAVMDAATEIMTASDVRGLMLEMDTPGGEAGGVFDLARFMRDLSEATGKPIWAHANELAASAGYAIASAAEQIWVSTTGEVGSIGVVAAHIDMSKADEKAGLKWSYIFAGDNKVDGNPHEPLTDGARADIQADVDDLYGMFVDLVSQHRGIQAEKIRDTKANVYRGTRAVESGLADELGTFDEALSAFAEHLDKMQTTSGGVATASSIRRGLMAGKSDKTKTEGQGGNQVDDANATAPGNDGGAATPPTKEDESAGAGDKPDDAATTAAAAAATDPVKAAVAEESKRCADLSAIGDQAKRLGVDFNVPDAIAKGTTASAAREAVMNAAAKRDEAPVSTASGGKSAGETSKDQARAAWSKAMKRR